MTTKTLGDDEISMLLGQAEIGFPHNGDFSIWTDFCQIVEEVGFDPDREFEGRFRDLYDDDRIDFIPGGADRVLDAVRDAGLLACRDCGGMGYRATGYRATGYRARSGLYRPCRHCGSTGAEPTRRRKCR